MGLLKIQGQVQAHGAYVAGPAVSTYSYIDFATGSGRKHIKRIYVPEEIQGAVMGGVPATFYISEGLVARMMVAVKVDGETIDARSASRRFMVKYKVFYHIFSVGMLLALFGAATDPKGPIGMMILAALIGLLAVPFSLLGFLNAAPVPSGDIDDLDKAASKA